MREDWRRLEKRVQVLEISKKGEREENGNR